MRPGRQCGREASGVTQVDAEAIGRQHTDAVRAPVKALIQQYEPTAAAVDEQRPRPHIGRAEVEHREHAGWVVR